MGILTKKCDLCGKRRLRLPFSDIPVMIGFESDGKTTMVCGRCLTELGGCRTAEDAIIMLERKSERMTK